MAHFVLVIKTIDTVHRVINAKLTQWASSCQLMSNGHLKASLTLIRSQFCLPSPAAASPRRYVKVESIFAFSSSLLASSSGALWRRSQKGSRSLKELKEAVLTG